MPWGEKQFSGFAPEAVDELCGYPWPENVEELAEVVEEACERADGPYIHAADLNAASVGRPMPPLTRGGMTSRLSWTTFWPTWKENC